MTATAVDESYEITAKFSVPEGGKAGLYLFYNEEAYFGLAGEAPELTLRIRNERNQASVWMQNADGEWVQDPEGVTDVSGYHHNNYKGFFALRPTYYLAGGAELKEFEYKPL
jgi:beta-xylosidase